MIVLNKIEKKVDEVLESETKEDLISFIMSKIPKESVFYKDDKGLFLFFETWRDFEDFCNEIKQEEGEKFIDFINRVRTWNN